MGAHPRARRLRGSRLRALDGGNPPAEGLNYFSPRETRLRPHSAVDLGGKGLNPSWGAGRGRGLRCERRGRRRVPEIHFQGRRNRSSCRRRKFLPLLLGVRQGRAAREPASPGRVSRRSPARGGRVPAASPKDVECWPGCKNEGTSQALRASGGISGPPGSVEIFEIHTVRPLVCECLHRAGRAGPPLPQVGAPGRGRSAPTKASSIRTRKEKRAAKSSKRPRL